MNNSSTSLAALGQQGAGKTVEGEAVERPGEGVVVKRVDEVGGEPKGVSPFAAVGEAEAAAMALSPVQQKAIVLLTSGSTAAEAAQAAGVGRSTLYRWLKDDAQFIAAYNAWQRDVLATAKGKMLALTDVALEALGKELARGNGKLALRVLERMGVAKRPRVGGTDVEEVKRQRELAAREADVERKKKETIVKGAEEELAMVDIHGAMISGWSFKGEKKRKGKR